MDLQSVAEFFMWCTIINGAILIFSTLFMMAAPEFAYRVQSRWFPMSRERYEAFVFGYLGLFKVMFIVFNVAPWLALLLMMR